MGFGFGHIPGMSRVTPVGRQDGDGAQQFARLQESERQHDNQMEFSRSEQERRQHEFATEFGLREQAYESAEQRKLRMEQEEAWKLLKLSRDRRDPEGIQAAERKLQNLGFDVGMAYTEEGGREPQTEGTSAPVTTARETTPRMLDADRAVQPRLPSFLDDMWPTPQQQAPGPPAQGEAAPPSPMQQGTELMRMRQMGMMPQAEKPGVLNFNPLAMLQRQSATEEQTEAAKVASRDTGLPIDEEPPERRAAGVAGAAAATGQAGQTPLEAAEAAEAMGVEQAAKRQRTVIRDPSGQVVDVWEPEEQVASQQRQYSQFVDAERKFSSGPAKRAWAEAKALVFPEAMPEWEKERLTRKEFWKFHDAFAAEERARIAASRPRSGPRPVNEWHQGVGEGHTATAKLRALGEKYTTLKSITRGIDSKNPILSGAAKAAITSMFQKGALSDKDIGMMNFTPSVRSKVMAWLSLETDEELDDDTSRRMAKAILTLENSVKRDAFQEYQGLRTVGSMANQYGERGHGAGFGSYVVGAASAFPGLAKPEHFGLSGGQSAPTQDPKKSKSILNKYSQ